MGVKIKSFGHFIPDHSVPNKELAGRFGITEEWILERTGIEEVSNNFNTINRMSMSHRHR
jgi:3-oxoacyl-[acyl-carrier-protein] synthase III